MDMCKNGISMVNKEFPEQMWDMGKLAD